MRIDALTVVLQMALQGLVPLVRPGLLGNTLALNGAECEAISPSKQTLRNHPNIYIPIITNLVEWMTQVTA